MPPLIEPFDIVVAANDAVARLQLPPKKGLQLVGYVTPPVVNLTHYNVSAACKSSHHMSVNRLNVKKTIKVLLLQIIKVQYDNN